MNIALSPDYQQVLRSQRIDEHGPGTVLRDFASLLNFIGEREIRVSGKHQFLPMQLLAEINARLSRPLNIKLQRPQQKSYPHINGLYLLLRTTGLAVVEGTGTKQALVLDQEALASWHSLNPTEAYCTLLEAWLLHGRAEVLGEYRGPFLPLDECLRFMQRIPDEGLQVAGNRQEQQMLLYYPALYNIALLELFGLITVDHAPPQAGEGWRIARLSRTTFGTALFQLFAQLYLKPEDFWISRDEATAEITFGQWQWLLQPFFPEWRENLVLPQPQMVDGLFIFKVSLGRVWRTIAIPAELTLESLSDAILQAFDFDNDHLYRFSYRNRFGLFEKVHHPFMDEPPFTTEVRIGELPLLPGSSMEYLFDFGDQWRFDVKLERVEPAEAKIKQPKVIEKHGKAPEQYPNWDEDDQW